MLLYADVGDSVIQTDTSLPDVALDSAEPVIFSETLLHFSFSLFLQPPHTLQIDVITHALFCTID